MASSNDVTDISYVQRTFLSISCEHHVVSAQSSSEEEEGTMDDVYIQRKLKVDFSMISFECVATFAIFLSNR